MASMPLPPPAVPSIVPEALAVMVPAFEAVQAMIAVTAFAGMPTIGWDGIGFAALIRFAKEYAVVAESEMVTFPHVALLVSTIGTCLPSTSSKVTTPVEVPAELLYSAAWLGFVPMPGMTVREPYCEARSCASAPFPMRLYPGPATAPMRSTPGSVAELLRSNGRDRLNGPFAERRLVGDGDLRRPGTLRSDDVELHEAEADVGRINASRRPRDVGLVRDGNRVLPCPVDFLKGAAVRVANRTGHPRHSRAVGDDLEARDDVVVNVREVAGGEASSGRIAFSD